MSKPPSRESLVVLDLTKKYDLGSGSYFLLLEIYKIYLRQIGSSHAQPAQGRIGENGFDGLGI